MLTIGVLLSGCGVYDGSEIHEAVLTLLALDRAGVAIQCLAPDMEQWDVINHLTGEPIAESRNVLVESARIARGNIKDIREISATDLE
ncbi:MAG: isoprenoid biosynthesis protein ElbB, partial [Deltaproteobacteria bacterium]|nr:isoprenoid biosynthesis protein ElbB [Deltaproteobacteria bacterium]